MANTMQHVNLSESASAEKDSEILRRYAEFHRRLGEMMVDLIQEAQVYWIGDLLEEAFGREAMRFVNTATGHDLHLGEEAENIYRKAIYIVPSAEPWEDVIQHLIGIQSHIMVLAGTKKPYHGILEPVLLKDVELARLRSQRSSSDRRILPKTFLRDLDAKLERLKATAAKFEEVSLEDEATKQIHKEVEHLNQVISIVGQQTEKLLVRTESARVLPNIYQGGKGRNVYVRDEGLILTGTPRVEIPPLLFGRRKDRVTDNMLTPLTQYDNVKVYSLESWEILLETLD